MYNCMRRKTFKWHALRDARVLQLWNLYLLLLQCLLWLSVLSWILEEEICMGDFHTVGRKITRHACGVDVIKVLFQNLCISSYCISNILCSYAIHVQSFMIQSITKWQYYYYSYRKKGISLLVLLTTILGISFHT